MKINNKHSILIMGGYTQWRLFKQLNIQDIHKTNKQIDRFKIILNQWENAINENKEVIILMDTNIDTLTDSNDNKANK